MSPRVADPFAGHFSPGDPRGPLSAAGGCTWPTIPPYRFWLTSDDATGDLAFFNVRPVLFQFASGQPAHNFTWWFRHGTHPDVGLARCLRRYTFAAPTSNWAFTIPVNAIPEESLNFNIDRPIETCNRGLPLPNTFAFDIDRGVTGDTFRLEQIEWDQTSPPVA